MCLVLDKTEKNYTNILKEEIRRKYGVSSSNKYQQSKKSWEIEKKQKDLPECEGF